MNPSPYTGIDDDFLADLVPNAISCRFGGASAGLELASSGW